jgi:chorismate mutase/prephenate dehydratase
MKIYTLGPDKSFSSFGAKKFCEANRLNPAKISLEDSFSKIWNKLKNNSQDIAIIPIENTSSSNVHENIDAIFDNPEVEIFAEFFLKINLHLIGKKGAKIEDIKEIYSHEKVFLQCKKFMENFAGNKITSGSTSAAAELLIKESDQSCAFIGGEYLLDEKSEIIQKNIANEIHNFTRFVVIGQNYVLEIPRKKNKATLIFETKHETGALAKILTTISLLNGNLLKIESRPIPEKPHNYSFWIDIDLEETPDNLFEILEKQLHSLRIVGVYEKGKTIVI